MVAILRLIVLMTLLIFLSTLFETYCLDKSYQVSFCMPPFIKENYNSLFWGKFSLELDSKSAFQKIYFEWGIFSKSMLKSLKYTWWILLKQCQIALK